MTTATMDTAAAPETPEAATAPAPAATGTGRRTEKDILLHSREFTAESTAASWGYTLSTLVILSGLVAAAALLPTWWMRLPFSVLAGLTTVRMFCLFHDFHHGAILRQSKPAEALFFVFGELILSPPSVWRETHNYHHQHTAKLIGSHIGSYLMMTPAMYGALTPGQKFMYRAIRHPLNMIFAIFTVFGLGMCISPFFRAPTKHWGGPLSLLVIGSLGTWAFISGHGDAFIFGWFIPMMLAAMSGAYLFYAQHNYPGVKVADRATWTYSGAAIESSSFFKMGAFMNWMTANIGYHHVHHLNATIPFYRLPEAMAGIPELQHPGETSWSPKDIGAALKLMLWDPDKGEMVGYPR
jgi:omega-6 fatty acid desaturase (delta-12 desaturase)